MHTYVSHVHIVNKEPAAHLSNDKSVAQGPIWQYHPYVICRAGPGVHEALGEM